jgi:azurin
MILKKTLVLLLFAVLSAAAFSAQAQTKTVKIVGKNNLRFSKSQITVSPGEKVKVTLYNHTKLPAAAMSHNWILLKQGVNATQFDSKAQQYKSNGYIPKGGAAKKMIAHTGLVSGGHHSSVTFTAPKKPGKYEYICTFPGHFAAGMKGHLIVKGS